MGFEIQIKDASFWKNSTMAVGLAKTRHDYVAGTSSRLCWYDPYDKGTLFQDTAGQVPVTADGQSVALMRDKSGYGIDARQTDAGARPIWKTDGRRGWLQFDGATQFMRADWPVIMSHLSRSVVAAVRITGGDERKTIVESFYGAGDTTSTGWQAVSLEVFGTSTIRATMSTNGGGGTNPVDDPGAYTLGTDIVIGHTVNGTTKARTMRRNGVEVASEVDDFATNTGQPSGFNLFVNRTGVAGGRRAAGRLYGFVIVSGDDPNPVSVETGFLDRL